MQALDSFTSNLLATFIGVLFAFGVTFWYDRWRRHKEKIDDEINTLLTLKKELEDNQEALEVEFDRRDLPRPILRTYGMDTAVSSGKLSLLEPELQTSIGSLYNIISTAERTSAKVWSIAGPHTIDTMGYQTNLHYFQDLYYEQIQTVKGSIPEVIQALEVRLKALTDP